MPRSHRLRCYAVRTIESSVSHFQLRLQHFHVTTAQMGAVHRRADFAKRLRPLFCLCLG